MALPAHRKLLLGAFVTLVLCVCPTPAFSQATASRIEAAAAFGAGSLGGISGGIPPAAETFMAGLRLSVGAPVRSIRVSAETELNVSGRGSGKGYIPGPPLATRDIYKETRRDILWSVLGGIQAWEPHRIGSLHLVAGLTRVKPFVSAATHPFDGGSDAWIATDVSYRSTWAGTLGIDLAARFGRMSVGPTYRWYGYLSSVSPYESGQPRRAALLGLQASYHF